ncbi:MAG: 5'/3'-nucleotidase SurE [Acidobacteriota bacterium]
MPRILITNDDGIQSEGMRYLSEALSEVGQVVVVAPDRERSAISRAITLHHPLRISTLDKDVHILDGTPTDCVFVGAGFIMKKRPDLVVAGINKGWNLGEDNAYSGTVSAAIQGTLLEVPSFAVSTIDFSEDSFRRAARFARKIAIEILHDRIRLHETTLSINFPLGEPKGVRWTRMGVRRYQPEVLEKADPRGRKYYWIGDGHPSDRSERGTDVWAVKHGYVSVTPLRLDWTDHDLLKKARVLELDEA